MRQPGRDRVRPIGDAGSRSGSCRHAPPASSAPTGRACRRRASRVCALSRRCRACDGCRLRGDTETPPHPGRFQSPGGKRADVHNALMEALDVGQSGRVRLRVALTERSTHGAASRRRVMGVAEVDQDTSDLGACGLGHPGPQNVNLGRLNRQRVDPARTSRVPSQSSTIALVSR